MNVTRSSSQHRLPLVPSSTRMWTGDRGKGYETREFLKYHPPSDTTVEIECWRPPTAREIGCHALKMGSLTAGLFAGLPIGCWGVMAVMFDPGAVASQVACQAAKVAGIVVPLATLVSAACWAKEGATMDVPVKGTISQAGPDDLVFRSDELSGPVSLKTYLQACEEAFPPGPLPPGNYMLQWNGRKATGSDQELDGASRKAASMVNAAWSKLHRAGLDRQSEAELGGLHWMRSSNGSGSLTWKDSDTSQESRVQFFPAQGSCFLTICGDHGSD